MKSKMLGVLAIATAAGGGWLAGVLTAPHKGTITRAKWRARMEEKKERSQEMAHDYRNKVRSLKRGEPQSQAS